MTAQLAIEGLSVVFREDDEVRPLLEDISLTLRRGEILGLVGESGSGKSLLCRAVMGLLPSKKLQVTAGAVALDGQALDLSQMQGVRGRRIGMIFQNPTSHLDPVMRIGAQISEGLIHHKGMTAAAAKTEAVALLAQVGFADPARAFGGFSHQFSGGMRQRAMIAVALACDPEILIADEPTTALDVTIQSQILKLMRRQIADRGASMILITHDLAVVSEMADHITVLYCGKVVERGLTRDVIGAPAHPYTRGLIDSIPDPRHRQTRLSQIPGTVPDIRNLPVGCSFRERCPRAQALCAQADPPLTAQRASLHAACHFPLTEAEAP